MYTIRTYIQILLYFLILLKNSGANPNPANVSKDRESEILGLHNDFHFNTTTDDNDGETDEGRRMSEILDSVNRGYDKRIRPNYGGKPVEVGVTMYVLSINSVSEVNMEFTMNLYFRQTWRDPRLKFKGGPRSNTISMDASFLSNIWIPDTFFVNEKKSEYHSVTVPQEFLRISENGDVLRSTRITTTASCPMDLRYFPMDRQLCNLEIESYRYSMSDISYKWAKGSNSVGMSSDVSLPQFLVLGYRQRDTEVSMATGNYSRLACEIKFVRSLGFYCIYSYFPASLIVVISWVAFWMNRASVPERVALGVTTVLTMTIMWTSMSASLPQISYIKSIDVFLGTCFVMVFASLLESASVGYLSKRILARQRKHTYIPEEGVSSAPFETTIQICGLTPVCIDKCSRIVFPLLFIIFKVMYWRTYLHISDYVEDDIVLLQRND